MKRASFTYGYYRFIASVSVSWLAGTILASSSVFAGEQFAPLTQVYSAIERKSDAVSWITRQASDNSLLFGSDSLVRFDGSHWQQYSANGSYALRGLDFAKSGRLWAAAVDEIGWFDPDPITGWAYHSLRSELSPEDTHLGEIWHAFAEGDGAVFVTAEKVLRWDGKKFHVWSFPGVRRIPAMRSASDIFFHHVPTGLYVMDRDGPRLVVPSAILGNAVVLWMESTADGYLFATSQGLFKYAGKKLSPFATEASDFVRRNLLTAVLRLADGRLLIGTYQGGVGLVDGAGKMERILDEKDGLPTRSIFSLFQDRENAIWVTSDSSIFRLVIDSPTTLFGRDAGLPVQPITKIVRYEDRLYFASANNIFELDGEKHRFISRESDVQQVTDLKPTPTGLLVAGLGGIKKISEGKASTVLATRQTAFVVQSARLHSDEMIVSENHSVVTLDANGQSRVLVKQLPDFATSLAEDSEGRLWIGTQNHGVLVAHVDSTIAVEAGSVSAAFNLVGSSGQNTVVGAPDGTILVFSSFGAQILGAGQKRFVTIEGSQAESITALSEVAKDGTVWAVYPQNETHAASVARITVKNNRASWQPHSVEGLWNIGTPESIFVDYGTNGEAVLWIGGNNGALRNVVAHGPLAPVPRAPLLNAFAHTKDSKTLYTISQPLPYSTRAISFEFAAPEFARRPALRLETMLDGVDQTWVQAGPSSEREFTALRDGAYTFRVRAVAETGATSPATVSHFEIAPPWWRTGTAIVCFLIALVPTGYGLYQWRIRILRQQNAHLEEKVRERTVQLAQASAAKTQFVAHMSHEIRNPLNGIVGLALELEDTALDLKQSEIVATLRECTTYLSTLVDDVLDFASIEAGRVDLRPRPFSPEELLSSIAAMLKIDAISSGASLHVETDPHLPREYVGDAGRIQQIVVNFVSNAMKYSGGRIKLSANIPVDAAEEVEFAVTDEGPGISEEGQKILFTKFTRLSDSHSKEITGTGLGLASCRLLAGLMGGSVGVHSSLGHGARFFLRLPLEIFSTEASDVSLPPPMIVPVQANCSVLLVEDTNYNARAASAVLAKFGLTCERASTGAEALKLFAEKRHNLVLLDRNLPDMDGTDVARQIRAMESDGPRSIMLAVTAYCTSEDRALCLNAGMDAFVGKPLTPEKLRRVLTAAGRRHLAAASMHVSPDVATTGVDVSLLEYISDGTDQGLNRQIELFLTGLSEAEKQLDTAARGVDFKALADAAHGVLSHARLVGSSTLSSAAMALERAARNHDKDAFRFPLRQVRLEIQSLTATVRRHPASEQPT